MLRKGDEPIPGAGYKLDKFLGRGTFGEVWRASGPHAVKVALKFIDISGKAGLKEYRGTQRVKDIRHAHLMPITAIWMLDEYGSVLDEKDVAGLEQPKFDASATMAIAAMQDDSDQKKKPSMLVVAMLLADDNLKDRLDECIEENGEGIPLDELLDYMEQAARGIDHLNLKEHDTGSGRATIQHCDIKPENIMLVGGSVVVCDFGLAQLLGDTQRTATGMLGTPAYIPPEVLTQGKPSHSSDQYSLALTYLHLRTANLPFDPTSSLPAVFEIHKTGKLNFQALAGNLERQVVKRAASVDPSKRYPSNLEFTKELRAAVGEDRRVAEELAGDKVKRWVKRAVAATLLLCVVGLPVYFATPAGRPTFAALLKLLSPADTTTTTSGSDGGQSDEETFQVRLAQLDTLRNNDLWREAFSVARALIASYPQRAEETTSKRAELVDELLARATDRLEEDPASAATDCSLLLSEVAEDPHLEENIEVRTLVAHARACARSGEWAAVGPTMDRLKDKTDVMTDEQRQVRRAVKVLLACSDDPAGFENVLEDLVRLEEDESTLDGSWEAKQLQATKAAAFELIKTDRTTVDLSDTRLFRIFPRGMKVLKIVKSASTVLFADSPDVAVFPQLRTELEEADRATEGDAAQVNVRELRAILELLEPKNSLAEAIESLPQELSGETSARRMTDLLLARAESEVLKAPLTSDVMPQIDDFLRRTVPVVGQPADSYSSHHLAVTVVDRLHKAEFNPAVLLADCEKVRDSRVELNGPLATIVDACWAECHLIQGASRSRRKDIAEIDRRLAQFPTDSHFAPYAAYVRTRIAGGSASADGRASAARMAEAISQAEMPAYLSGKQRAQYVGDLLIDAADALKTGEDSQIISPAYEPAAAKTAYQWMEIAWQKLGADSTRLRRNLALARYYGAGSDEKKTVELLRSLKLSAEVENDGQLLRVRADANAGLAGDEVKAVEATLESYGELFAWARKHRSSDSKTKHHQDILQPALEICHGLGIRGFQDLENQIDVEAVPTPLWTPAARIFALSGKLVADDVDTALELFPDDDADAVRHRYFCFRAAAALEPKEGRHLVGQYLALSELPGIEYKALSGKLFQLATKAHELNPEDAETNGILGEAWVFRSRQEVDTAKRKNYLRTAIKLLTKALESSGTRETQEKFLPLRSTANVEMGYVLGTTSPEKIACLQTAVNDAREAANIPWRLHPEAAHLTWGNAAEDLAHYCLQDPERNFKEAINQFTRAAREANTAHAKSQALMAAGRCRYRRIFNVQRKRIVHTALESQSEVDAALKDLSDALTAAQGNDIKSEIKYWLSEARYLKAALDQDPASSKALRESADRDFREAIQLAGALQWATLSYGWARRAYAEANYPQAISRAKRILDERDSGTYVVHWQRVFDAMLLIFLSTPPADRPGVLDQYARYLPEEDESAIPFRASWFLLGPQQLRPEEYLGRAALRSDVRLAGYTLDPDTLDTYAEKARQLAQPHNLALLEANANVFQALAAYRRWEKAGKPADLTNARTSAVATKLSLAAKQLDAIEYAGLTAPTLTLFAVRHATVFKDVYLASSTSAKEKDRIRTEEVKRLKELRRRVPYRSPKRSIQQLIDRIES